MERRRHKRHRRRLKVRYGENNLDRTGFTGDVSVSGLFIAALPSPSLQSRLHVELVYAENKSIFFEGIVQRIVEVEPQLRTVARGGFGVRFLSPGELFNELMPHQASKLRVSYGNAESFIQALPEVRRGGLYLRTEKPPVLNTVVPVEIEIPWKQRTIEVQCRVVHVSSDGVAVVFMDAEKTIEELTRVAELATI